MTESELVIEIPPLLSAPLKKALSRKDSLTTALNVASKIIRQRVRIENVEEERQHSKVSEGRLRSDVNLLDPLDLQIADLRSDPYRRRWSFDWLDLRELHENDERVTNLGIWWVEREPSNPEAGIVLHGLLDVAETDVSPPVHYLVGEWLALNDPYSEIWGSLWLMRSHLHEPGGSSFQLALNHLRWAADRRVAGARRWVAIYKRLSGLDRTLDREVLPEIAVRALPAYGQTEWFIRVVIEPLLQKRDRSKVVDSVIDWLHFDRGLSRGWSRLASFFMDGPADGFVFDLGWNKLDEFPDRRAGWVQLWLAMFRYGYRQSDLVELALSRLRASSTLPRHLFRVISAMFNADLSERQRQNLTKSINGPCSS